MGSPNQYTKYNLWVSKVVHFFSRTVKLARAMEQLLKNSNGLGLDHHKYLHGIGNIKCFRRCQEREQKMISKDHRKRRRFRSRYWFALMILKGTYGEQFVKRTTWLQESKPLQNHTTGIEDHYKITHGDTFTSIQTPIQYKSKMISDLHVDIFNGWFA